MACQKAFVKIPYLGKIDYEKSLFGHYIQSLKQENYISTIKITKDKF